MNKSLNIIVAGAGLVGGLLAIGLKKQGHHVTVFERRPDLRKDPTLAGRSINLIMTAKGIHPVHQLGLWDRVQPILVPVSSRCMHNREGETVYQPYGRDESECNFSVSRYQLNALLLDIAEENDIPVHFEKELTDIHFDQKTAHFGTDQKIPYDLFLGTDGAGSRTRSLLIQSLPDAHHETIALGTDYKEMTMPLREGNPPLDTKALHIWPRGEEMLMALPNLDGSFTMTIYMKKTKFDALDEVDKIQDHFTENYRDAMELMPELKREFLENPVGRLATAKVSHWTNGTDVALLGDAAHAIVPFFGQGMNSGFWDVHNLLTLLEQHNDIPAVITQYEQRQKPNGVAVAELSLQNFHEMCSHVGDETFLTKKRLEHRLQQHFPELYRARYGMVTYTLLDYHQALDAGIVLDEIIDQLLAGKRSEEEVDLNQAKRLLEQRLSPWLEQRGLSLERYQIPGQA